LTFEAFPIEIAGSWEIEEKKEEEKKRVSQRKEQERKKTPFYPLHPASVLQGVLVKVMLSDDLPLLCGSTGLLLGGLLASCTAATRALAPGRVDSKDLVLIFISLRHGVVVISVVWCRAFVRVPGEAVVLVGHLD